MGVLGKLFGGGFSELGEEEYIELDTQSDAAGAKVPIRVFRLEDFADTDPVQKAVREGAIVLLKIKPLKEKDISELKRAIDKLRKTCIALNGDIAGIDEDFVVLCPNFAHVARD